LLAVCGTANLLGFLVRLSTPQTESPRSSVPCINSVAFRTPRPQVDINRLLINASFTVRARKTNHAPEMVAFRLLVPWNRSGLGGGTSTGSL
jgi:hypothetical protein